MPVAKDIGMVRATCPADYPLNLVAGVGFESTTFRL